MFKRLKNGVDFDNEDCDCEGEGVFDVTEAFVEDVDIGKVVEVLDE